MSGSTQRATRLRESGGETARAGAVESKSSPGSDDDELMDLAVR
jgi:hypothetical protein